MTPAAVQRGAAGLSRPTDQVICEALRLALVATQLRVAWHAGAMTAEGAMQLLDQALREICVRNGQEANPTERTDSSPSYRTT